MHDDIDVSMPVQLANDILPDRKLRSVRVSTILIDLGRKHMVFETMVFDEHDREIVFLTRQFPAVDSGSFLDSASYHRDIVEKIRRGIIDGEGM